jgi:dolichol-phosphate mannosyltransferase
MISENSDGKIIPPVSDFSLTIIILAYNEEESIIDAVRDVSDFLKEIRGRHEIVIINDGSTDRTLERAGEAENFYPYIKIISHDKNMGMGAGTRTGLKHAEGNYFTIIGADRQISPFELKKMIPCLEDSDIVVSSYTKRPGFMRKILSKGMRLFMRIMLNFSIPYEGLYIFPVQIIREKIGLNRIKSNSFFFSFEMLYHAARCGYRISSVPIECIEREKGRSKVANFRGIFRVFSEISHLALREKILKNREVWK